MPSPEFNLPSIMPDTVISPLGVSQTIWVRAIYRVRGALRISVTFLYRFVTSRIRGRVLGIGCSAALLQGAG
jgi:hypothetical protein